jgi:hypothetical protein
MGRGSQLGYDVVPKRAMALVLLLQAVEVSAKLSLIHGLLFIL